MKKNYFMLAAAALMFAACAETDFVNPVPVNEGEAIGFETFANLPTKATENNDTTYTENDLHNHHTTFNVWASKQLADNSYVVVYADATPGTVTYAASTWTASPLKYWDKAASKYYFYAAAPAGLDWDYSEVTDGSDGYLTLNDFVLTGANLASGTNTATGTSWSGKADKDLLIAAPCLVNKGSYNKPDPDNVNLDFIHILSRLNIAVKTTTTGVVLTKLDVVGLVNAGDFNENASLGTDVLANGTTKRWNADGAEYTLSGAGLAALTKDAAAVYTHEYLIIPQLAVRQDNCKGLGAAPANDAYVQIEYTLNGEAYKVFYGLAEVFGKNIGESLAFNEGWQNTLTISIEPDAISFTGDVAVWGEGSGSLPIE